MPEKLDHSPSFDYNGPGIKGQLFGLPFSPEESSLVIVPVPWEVTVSQRAGTAHGPRAVCDASFQIDLFARSLPEIWKVAFSMLPVPEKIRRESDVLRSSALRLIALQEKGEPLSPDNIHLAKVNEACENLNGYVKNTTRKLLQEGRQVGVLGGDHSTPLGFLRALAEVHDRFGILQIDAHADLRKKYEGFSYSHASIMYNALKLPSVVKLVQVGLRDICDEEYQAIRRYSDRVKTYFDEDLQAANFAGQQWKAVCSQIIGDLPEKVYISFDIDGLDPANGPATGTPVPGGLSFAQARYLLHQVASSGKKIIGFDLCEVSGENQWDAQVGARLLFELCTASHLSQVGR